MKQARGVGRVVVIAETCKGYNTVWDYKTSRERRVKVHAEAYVKGALGYGFNVYANSRRVAKAKALASLIAGYNGK